MLSQSLDSLVRRLRERAAGGGVYLTPEEAAVVVRILGDLASQARSLERQVVPSAAREPLPPGVVDMMERRARGTALAGRRPGGDAA